MSDPAAVKPETEDIRVENEGMPQPCLQIYLHKDDTEAFFCPSAPCQSQSLLQRSVRAAPIAFAPQSRTERADAAEAESILFHRTALQVETISPLLLSSELNSIPVSPSKTIFP